MKRPSDLRKILEILGPARRRLPVVMLVALVDAVMAGLGIGLILPVFQALMDPQTDNALFRHLGLLADAVGVERVLPFLAGLTVVVFAVKGLAGVARAALVRNFAESMRRTWIEQIGRAYMMGPYTWTASQKHGELLNVWVQETQSGSRFLQSYLTYWTQTLQVLALIAVGMIANWQAMLGLLAGAMVILLTLRRSAFNWATNLGERKLTLYQRMTREMSETLTNLRDLKLLTIEPVWLARIATDAERLRSHFVRVAILAQLPNGVGEFLGVTALMAFVVIGVSVMGMDPQTLVPFLAFFLVTFYRIITAGSQAMTARMKALHELRGLEEVHRMANHAVRLEDRESGLPVQRLETDLVVEGLSFQYGEGSPILSGLDLVIPRGRVTFIIGPSGSGKSTLLDLFMRLYRPATGRITANGRDIEEYNLIDWRRLFGYVSQDAALFNGTIRENLLRGAPDASAEEMENACRLSGAQEFIEGLPQGYDTPVGDRGFAVSGGQRKRIAIARAMMRRPEVLILDEATTSFEESMERTMIADLRKARQDLTVIQITHRLQTAPSADNVIVLSQGRVAAQGPWSAIAEDVGALALAEPEQQERPS
ncbi:ABC transporter ATP-binding protein [Pelagibius sp. 7325]|uniref:ABC transporter ATP-binding protein n=1 Tax=Pelagibius sp. 7325 TaxID=3131994 RepID=UPI0030EC850F